MPDEVWAAFATAGFSCWLPDQGADPLVVTVRGAAVGIVDGPFPFEEPVTFLTADNPHGQVVAEVENLRRRAAFAATLEARGLAWYHAVAEGPAGDHEEPGAAIPGLDLATAVELGAQMEQAAVYRWEPQALHLVACTGGRHDVLGYRASSMSSSSVAASTAAMGGASGSWSASGPDGEDAVARIRSGSRLRPG